LRDRSLHAPDAPFDRPPVSVGGTFAAMRSIPYRWLWSTTLASTSGRWAVLMVAGWLAYRMTGSAAGSALASLLAFAPALFVGPVSGALADRMDRRRLIQAGAAVSGAMCLAAAVLAAANRLPLALVLLVPFAAGVGVTLEQPSRISLVSLVSHPEDRLNAFALLRIPMQGAEMVGPALATAVLAAAGPAPALALCAVFYVLAVLQAPRIVVADRPAAAAQPAAVGVIQSLREGLAYVRQERQLGALLAWIGLH
jgi:MFS family permease